MHCLLENHSGASTDLGSLLPANVACCWNDNNVSMVKIIHRSPEKSQHNLSRRYSSPEVRPFHSRLLDGFASQCLRLLQWITMSDLIERVCYGTHTVLELSSRWISIGFIFSLLNRLTKNCFTLMHVISLAAILYNCCVFILHAWFILPSASYFFEHV